MRRPALPRPLETSRQSLADRVAGSDPGLNRLILATCGALTIGVTISAEGLFVHLTGALQVVQPLRPTAAQSAAVARQHHDILVTAMLLGGLVALRTALNVSERTVLGQAITLCVIPVATVGALALGLGLGPHRLPALVVMVVVLTAGAYARRVGPRGSSAGILLFTGYFYGFFLSNTFPLSAIGWLAAEVFLAATVAAIVRFTLFRPTPARDLRRAMRSYEARARRVMDLGLEYFDEPDDRRRRRLHRWLLRLDAAGLIVEGQLDEPRALPSGSAVHLHQWLFDAELALTNAARYVEALAAAPLPPQLRNSVRQALAGLAGGDADAVRRAAGRLRQLVGQPPYDGAGRPSRVVLLFRYAAAVELLAGTLEGWSGAARERSPDGADAGSPFHPAVALTASQLPGSAEVSREAATGPGTRVRLAPYLRTTVQMTVAVSLAIAAGAALDPLRFYWAVLAVVLVLMGTNTVAEQVQKATLRVVGTLAGVVAGTALVDAVGTHSVWSVAAVVASMWLGLYLFRVNYAFTAMAVTISLSQAYLSLGEFSGSLLLLRLAETAVGAAVAMVTVLVVVPLRTGRVVDVAAADLVDALAAAAEAGAARLRAPATRGGDLRSRGRDVDVAFQALVATAEPLRMVSWADSRDRVARLLKSAAAARNYGRNLVLDAERAVPQQLGTDAIDEGRLVLGDSAARLARRLRVGDAPPYVRASHQFESAESTVAPTEGPPPPSVLVLRDLTLLDGTLATMARGAGLPISSPGTDTRAQPPPVGPEPTGTAQWVEPEGTPG